LEVTKSCRIFELSNNNNMKNMKNIKKINFEGDWYWIPKHLLQQFEIDCDNIAGLEYLDSPDDFDSFETNYSQYKTGGDKNVTPKIFSI
jgi:hypothetical protein